MKFLIFCTTFLLTQLTAFAQDIQLTQFNASPVYLNPAMVGTTITSRLAANFRTQWTAVAGGMNTSMCSFDHNVYGKNIGLGIQAFDDQQGRIGPRTTGATLAGSYGFQLSKAWMARAGLQATFGSRSIDYKNLLFVDQFDNGGPTDLPTQETLGKDQMFYASVGAGGFLYSNSTWIGISASHLNKPSMTFFTDQKSALPMKLSVQAGRKISLNHDGTYSDGTSKDHSMSLVAQYRMQGAFDQLDLGVYYTNEPLIFGVWYRGIPLKQYAPGIGNHDALAAMMGLAVKSGFTVGYSFDYPLSSFGMKTGGSHEISLVYQWAMGDHAKKMGRAIKRGERFHLPCPSL